MRALIISGLLLATSVVAAQFDVIRTLTPEQGQEVRRPVEARIFGAAPEERPALEAALLDIFRSSTTTLEGRRYACRMLRFCASDACVPVLAPGLTRGDLSAYVRMVLQGLQTPAAEQALIEALPRAGSDIKVGIIGTLGQHRGSPEAVDAVAPYLQNSTTELQLAAMTALANIGGERAARHLVNARVQPRLVKDWKRAQLRCASTLDAETAGRACRRFLGEEHDDSIRAAALVGMVTLFPDESAELVFNFLTSGDKRLKSTAAGLLYRLPADRLAAQLGTMEPENRLRMLHVLAERRASEAEEAVLKLASEDPAMRKAAYAALSEVGGADTLVRLLDEAPGDPDAFSALCALKAGGTDDALMQMVKSADGDKVRSCMIECLARRRVTAALPLFRELAEGAWSRSCRAAVEGMVPLVTETDFIMFAELLTASDRPEKTRALEQSMGAAAQRLDDRDACARPLVQALDQAEGETAYGLVRALGSIGGEEAYAVLNEAAAGPDAEMRNAAIRGLANWPTLEAAPGLLDLAQSSEDEKLRVLALRGYIRLAGTVSDSNKAIIMCLRAEQAAARPEELKAVISCIKRFRTRDVLDFLTRQLDNEAVFREAGWAICEISNDSQLRKSSIPVLERIAETADDEALSDQARKLVREYSS
jgi:HEAT repeat protein